MVKGGIELNAYMSLIMPFIMIGVFLFVSFRIENEDPFHALGNIFLFLLKTKFELF